MQRQSLLVFLGILVNSQDTTKRETKEPYTIIIVRERHKTRPSEARQNRANTRSAITTAVLLLWCVGGVSSLNIGSLWTLVHCVCPPAVGGRLAWGERGEGRQGSSGLQINQCPRFEHIYKKCLIQPTHVFGR